MAPRYLFKGWQSIVRPSDIDIMRWISQRESHRDLNELTPAVPKTDEALKNIHAAQGQVRSSFSSTSRTTSRRSSVAAPEPRFARPSMDIRTASRTDMSTGLTSVERGFDFATEERGVALQRIQTNLSERRESRKPIKRSVLKGKEALSHMLSLKRMTRGSRGSGWDSH